MEINVDCGLGFTETEISMQPTLLYIPYYLFSTEFRCACMKRNLFSLIVHDLSTQNKKLLI